MMNLTAGSIQEHEELATSISIADPALIAEPAMTDPAVMTEPPGTASTTDSETISDPVNITDPLVGAHCLCPINGSVIDQQSTSATETQTGSETLVQTSKLDFDPFGYLKQAMKLRLQDNLCTIFAGLIAVTVIFRFTFGWLAIHGLFCLSVIVFALTILQKLLAKYEVSFDGSALLILKKSWFGNALLRLPWDKMQTVERLYSNDGSVRELRIHLKKESRLNLVEALEFNDLLDSLVSTKKVTIPLEQANRSDSICEGADATSLESHDPKVEFLSRLSELTPENLLTANNESLPDTSLKTKLLQGSEGYLVDYTPLARAEKQLSKKLDLLEGRLTFAMSLCTLAAVILLGPQAFWLLTGILAILILSVLGLKEVPRKLLLTPEGLSIIWQKFKKTRQGRFIPWTCVESVSSRCLRSQTNGSPDNKIEFILNPAKLDPQLVKLLSNTDLTGGLVFKRGNQLVMTLDIGEHLDQAGRHELLSAINKYLPGDRVNYAVREALNPTDPASYTQLWLETLGNESVRQSDAKLAVGQRLRNGEFEIESFVGAGGQANVYLANRLKSQASDVVGARHARPSQSEKASVEDRSQAAFPIEEPEIRVVLKEFILPSHAGADLSVRSLKNIQKELELVKRLEHANVVRYFDIFVEDHRCYLVLEHVNGKSLRAIVEESGPMPEEQVVVLAKQMAEILQHLHSQSPSVVHRDFTPENLILDQNGVLKLIDFNVAQELEENATRTIVGKHSYLPPEQFRGKACPQSDIYAFGATLHFLLTAEDPEPISCSHPILKNEFTSGELDNIVSRSTELELENRFVSASEIITELKKIN